MTRRISKPYSSTRKIFFNMSFVTILTTNCIPAFSSLTSTIGVAKILFWSNPTRKKSRGVISGERRCQGFGPSLSAHRSGNVSFRKSHIILPSSVGVHYFDEKLPIFEIFLTAVQGTVGISHVKKHLTGTGILLRRSPSY